MSGADLLAPLNACLNSTVAICLLLGYREIRRGNKQRHKLAMLGAFGASTLFLASYLTRWWLTGTHPFPVGGGWKLLYLGILFSHMILAMVLVPMVFRTLFLARKERFAEHRKAARFTFPIWVYVSLTGVVVYAMLYHLPGWLG